jgi:hypothetical protein
MAVTVFIKDITKTHYEPNHSIPIQLESDIYISIWAWDTLTKSNCLENHAGSELVFFGRDMFFSWQTYVFTKNIQKLCSYIIQPYIQPRLARNWAIVSPLFLGILHGGQNAV